MAKPLRDYRLRSGPRIALSPGMRSVGIVPLIFYALVFALLMSWQLSATTDADKLPEKIQKSVSQLVNSPVQISNLVCAKPQPALDRGPASVGESRHELEFQKIGDERRHRLDADLIQNRPAQIRTLTLVGEPEKEIAVENEVWKTFTPQDNSFTVDAHGSSKSMELTGPKKSLAIKSAESVAQLISQCCDQTTCLKKFNSHHQRP